MKNRGGDKHIHQQIPDEAAKAKIRYQTLMTEYLQLQKENVRRQRKLRTTKQKKVVLLSQVRFLRRRVRFLKENNPSAIKQPGHVHNPNVDVEIETRNGEADFSDLVPTPSMNPYVADVGEEREEEVEIVEKEATQVKISKNYFSGADKLRNYKDESCHNHVPLEV